MEELRRGETEQFIEKWGDFHDAVVQAVDFDLDQSTVTLALHAQDRRRDWAWQAVLIAIEGLAEWSFAKPERFDARVIFEAGIMWDGERVLLSLDTKSTSPAEVFRSSPVYFGGATIRYEVSPLPE
jgi:hypothetical protein